MARKGAKPPPGRRQVKTRRRKLSRSNPRAVPSPLEDDASAPAGPHPHPFPVVGVGASAGGLEAFSQLLRNLPNDTGMAFVLVQHLAPKHESVLPSILARDTAMPVREAEDGMRVEPNHVYVIPADQDMVIRDGNLALQARTATEGRHLPVDLFLRTLADVQGSQSVAVVMSGTGSDGTLGCKAVKAAGGISFAQEPESAKYDGMPRSAIAAGCVDLVLPPEGIAREIQRLSGEEYLRPLPEKEVPPPTDEERNPFDRILGMLKTATDTDFRCYKKPTLLRRIRRRMTLWNLDRLNEYVRWLEQNPSEVESLHQDLLINVTTFFRDPATFDALAQEICPEVLRDRPAEAPVRIWVPGCATGEEAYSIAICLLEALTRSGSIPPVQVFGTDLSAKAIEKARTGIYMENIAADVSPERLARFFVKGRGNYQVSKAVRDLCVFAQHNIIRDPPFSRLDLISCRNVLIYLEAPHQKRVLSVFHYALQPNGFLMLGPSETVGASELFDVRLKEHRVYVKKKAMSQAAFSLTGGYVSPTLAKREVVTDEAGGRLHVQKEADRVLLARYGPPGVLVDDNLDILHFRGDTSAYLEHTHGEASLNLMRMLRKGPVVEVRQAIEEARSRDMPARRELRLRRPGGARRVTVEAIPIRGPSSGKGRCFLVLFAEKRQRPPRIESATRAPSENAKDTRLAELEQELASTRYYQQSLLEGQEAANEELQSAHEEVLSSNEELQSINEELETAKEELQSTNEELTTVNEELQNRNGELSQTTDDIVNLLASLNAPIVMLGSDLRLRRFTPAAARLYNLIPGDIGRPLGDLRGTLNVANLEAVIREAIDTVSVRVQEVADHEGHWYSLRVHPYKTEDNHIDGAVLLLVDIDEMKKAAERLEQARSYAEAIVDTDSHPLLILDARMRVERGNRSFYEMFGTTAAEVEGRALFDLGARQWDLPELRQRLERLAPHGAAMDEFKVEAEFSGLGPRTMIINARRLSLGEPEPSRILLAIDDRTQDALSARQRERLLMQEEAAARRAESASRLKDEFIATVSHELRGPLNAMAGWVHVLGSGALDPATVSRGLAALERAVKAQTRLIEDLLDMSRIMSGKLRLAHRFIDLGEVTRAAMETAGPAAEAKSIHIDIRSDGQPLFVLGDPDRLQQVVWNVLSNAVKFTPREGRIEVDLRRKGTSTQLRVTDSGQGISPEFLPYIFEPFRQADSSPARAHQGLGLGLAISRHLVESHGGVIRAESAGVGRGTTITLLLPVPPLAADMTPTEEQVADAPKRLVPDRSFLSGVRVVVVEDEADSREILTAVLSEWGAEVSAVSSAAEALDTLKARRPDVLVSDIGMPGMDGYELVRELRKRGAGNGGDVPAIALTAYTGNEGRSEALAAGFDEHVAKPAEPRELLAAVARLAGRRAPPGA